MAKSKKKKKKKAAKKSSRKKKKSPGPSDAVKRVRDSITTRLRALDPETKSKTTGRRRKTPDESDETMLALETFIDRELLGDVQTRSQMQSILSAVAESIDQPHSRILFALVHEKLPESEAKRLWKGILIHKARLESSLGRGVRLQVAAVDYFTGQGKGDSESGEDMRLQLITHGSLERLIHSALHDGLTGAYSHSYFHQVLQEEFYRARRYKRPVALLMVDIDDFKSVNDRFGHQTGDRLLVAVSDILTESLRQSDRLARYGGEEFAVILPETRKPGASALAEKLRKSLADQAATRSGIPTQVTASVGVATLTTRVKLPFDLVRGADMALYQAKLAGKNQVVHWQPGGRGKVGDALVLSADKDSTRAITKVLRASGVRVRGATAAMQALELAIGKPPDVVVIEHNLPEGNLQRFCQLLRQNPITREVPVVAVVPGRDTETREALREVGVEKFVASSNEDRSLLRAVSTYLKSA